jgi:methylaspartate ammonia-lyase
VRIRGLLTADALGAYWYDDQAAVRAGAVHDGFDYAGSPRTPGFERIRMPARALSVGLVLDDGHVAWGDAMTVQYSGAGGREPPFDPTLARAVLASEVAPRVAGLELDGFRADCARVFSSDTTALRSPALRYGLSQGLLAAHAHAARTTMAEVLCADYGLPVVPEPVPLFAQSGDDRHANIDKMILKRVGVLPHGLINNREKLGPRGATFAEYARWVAKRVRALGDRDYVPVLHFDLYGTAGLEFDGDVEAIADFLARLGESLAPFRVRIETPFDFGSHAAQLDGFARLRAALARLGSAVELVADEWCDTLDDVRAFANSGAAHLVQIKMPDVGSLADSAAAVLECRRAGIEAYLGGSCAETDVSARAAVHVALATRPAMLLAKPGMGVDEGLTIVGNEQSRALAELRARLDRGKAWETTPTTTSSSARARPAAYSPTA